MQRNRKKVPDIYRKRQTALLICVCAILIALIALAVVLIFSKATKNTGDTNDISAQSSGEAVPADVQDETMPYHYSIRFETDKITIKVGETYKPVLLNSQSDDDILYWESSNEAVAIVADDGTITGIGGGSCKIYAAVRNTDTLLELSVVVVNPGPEIVEKDGITYVDGILIANKTYSLPSDYEPGVDPEAQEAFDEMAADAAKEGLDMYISSGFRSYEYQSRIYNNYCNLDGQENADRYSARPGHSEHQSGLAFDLNSIDDSFADTPEYEWLKDNCHKYGFIIRYPENKEEITGYKYESWHIRYLGVDIATDVYESGLCLEEYLGIDSVYAE